MSFRSRRRRRLSGVLALACLGALAAIYLELDEPLSRPARSMPGGAAGLAAPAPEHDLDFAMPALATFAEITLRPLFSPARRPQAVAARASEGAETAAALPDLVLRGVASAGASRVALLQRADTAELLRVFEGESVDGWRVQAIGARTVELLGRGEAVVLELEQDRSPPPQERRRRVIDAGPAEAEPGAELEGSPEPEPEVLPEPAPDAEAAAG